MSQFLLYIIESGLVLAFFYLLYLFLFSNETFFQFNRFVLIFIPVVSLLIPFLSIDIPVTPIQVVDQQINGVSKFSKSYYDAMASWDLEAGQTLSTTAGSVINWKLLSLRILILIYFSGLLVSLFRAAQSIRWIVNAIKSHSCLTIRGIRVVRLSFPTAPFSFMRYVFVYTEDVESKDFHQVLEHERVHIQEKHTIDLLYVQLIAAIFWFNPFIWQLLKSLKTTHEYIADKKIIELGYSVDEYQALLLKQLISNNSFELVHNFNLSFIKKRITMMTNKKSGWAGRARAGIALIAMFSCSAFMMQCNGRIEDQVSFNKISGTQMNADVPVLPASDFRYEGDLSEALTFTISDNTLRIGEKEAEISEIQLIQSDDGRRLPIIMKVDKDQNMGFVRKVQMALRVADRRKLLYTGQTESGDRVEVALTLPPDPDLSTAITDVPEEHQLKIEVGNSDGSNNKMKVYEFVSSFIERGEGWLPVISVKMDDDDSFDGYLKNFFFAKEGYIQIYQERSQKFFGKDFYKTSKEEFKKVRENIPMNISIAEG